MKPCGPHTARRRLLTTTGYFNIGLHIQLELQHGAGRARFGHSFALETLEYSKASCGCIYSNVIARVL